MSEFYLSRPILSKDTLVVLRWSITDFGILLNKKYTDFVHPGRVRSLHQTRIFSITVVSTPERKRLPGNGDGKRNTVEVGSLTVVPISANKLFIHNL